MYSWSKALFLHKAFYMLTNMPPIVIAVDGYSSCGKSTLAKNLAKTLNYRFVDSGAMYRACTLYLLDQNISIDDVEAVTSALDHIHISFDNLNGINTTFLNGQNVEEEIRSLRVSQKVSEVAAIKSVRTKMVELQQAMGREKGIVMDGRDIGSVVFPDAEVKIFVEAEMSVRVMRRYNELIAKGKNVSREEVAENLKHRDHIDSTRKESPLTKTEDHITLDNSYLSREEQTLIALQHIQQKVLV